MIVAPDDGRLHRVQHRHHVPRELQGVGRAGQGTPAISL